MGVGKTRRRGLKFIDAVLFLGKERGRNMIGRRMV